jgi:hypothetical protein
MLAVAYALQGGEATGQKVRVPLQPTGGSGPIKASGLQARINGNPAVVTRLQAPGDDMIILLVFDVTGDLALIDPAKQAIFERLNGLPKNTYVGVMRASEGLQVLAEPSGDRAATASSIANLTVGSKAEMLEVVQPAAAILDAVAAKSGVRTALIVITDSDVGNYREDYTNPVINYSDSRDLSRRFPEGLIREKITKLEEALGWQQTPIYFVHLAYRTDRLNEAYQTGLLRLASTTGGTGSFCRSVTEIPGAANRIFDAALGHYEAWLQVPKVSRNLLIDLQAQDATLTYRTHLSLKPGT